MAVFRGGCARRDSVMSPDNPPSGRLFPTYLPLPSNLVTNFPLPTSYSNLVLVGLLGHATLVAAIARARSGCRCTGLSSTLYRRRGTEKPGSTESASVCYHPSAKSPEECMSKLRNIHQQFAEHPDRTGWAGNIFTLGTSSTALRSFHGWGTR